jgi:hypothetical protein
MRNVTRDFLTVESIKISIFGFKSVTDCFYSQINTVFIDHVITDFIRTKTNIIAVLVSETRHYYSFRSRLELA